MKKNISNKTKKVERIRNFILTNKKKIEVFAISFIMAASVSVPAFAEINGNTIKTNILNNFVLPIYIIILVGLLVKEFLKKNIASAVMILLVGGLIGIFVYNPDSIKIIIDTITSTLGI